MTDTQEKTPQQEYDEMFSRLQTDDKYAAAMAYVMKQDFLSYMVTMFYLINCQRMMLKDFHLTVIKKLQGLVDGTNTKRNLALCLPVGCLSGDTVIRYNRASLGRKMTIKDMYLKQNNLPSSRKWNLKIPTFVRSFIEKDNQIRLNKVDCIIYSGKKMVYELLLEDGKSVKATIEHKIMTDKGFVELGQLKVGDLVMVDNVVGKKKKEVSEATYRQNRKEKTKCVGKYHPYSKTCDGYSWRVELHRAIYEAHLNNMSLEDFCLACKSPNNLKFINPKTHHIHHIDGNHSNNIIENLQCLTRAEHLKVHGNYNHFGYGKPEYSAVKNVSSVGYEDVYDITCFDNQNFNANDIIVHNSGKSLLTEYFISWCFARSRDNAFVYTSHSEDLITKMSAEIRSICTFPMWQRLFGWVLKKDDRQKTNFSFEGAKNRTGLRAKAINSAITGLDAGNPAVDGFSGALVCFPYNQKVLTEKGAIEIGKIVEDKLNVRVFSYNFAKQCIELQNIDNYITNPADDIVRVTLKNGTSFECTKNHKVWTSNRGYIEAQELIGGVDKVITMSNPLDLINSQTCFINDEIPRVISISDKIKSFLWQSYLFSWFIVNFTCKSFKRFTCFNGLYRTYTAVKSLSNFSIISFISCYINYIFSGQIATRKYESTEFNSILHIFGFSTIGKIFKAIIGRVRVKMSDFHTNRSFSDKSQKNKLMNTKRFSFGIFEKLNSWITSTISSFKNSFRQKISTTLTSFIFYPMFKSFDNSRIRNLIKSFIIRNVLVDNVCFVRHDNNSFCLTVHYNHNMFVGDSQGVLVKNCDDAMDAGNAIYEIERENVIRIYNEKLATRRRTPTTPTILIMQRLHPEDLVGWVEKNQPELWDIVKVKALNDDGTSFWEERYPAEELRMLEKRQGALFQAQYQQEPVITGGSVIKTEWFKYYQQHPKYERIFMTSDTAMKANEWNDYSVLQLWGKYQNGLYLIDMIRGKWEVPDLIQKTRDFVKKYRLWENRILLSALYVEDRGSGVGLIQQLRRETPVPILPLKPNKKDKVTRAKEIAYYIESGMVFLPQDKDYSFNRELLTEVELFSADGGCKHDDIIDCITYAVTIGIAGVGSSIFD